MHRAAFHLVPQRVRTRFAGVEPDAWLNRAVPATLLPMARAMVRRLLAGALIFMISAGGSGLPVLDALIYHSRGPTPQDWQTHYEANGGCHADGCAIKSTAQHARFATGIGTPSEFAPSIGEAPAPLAPLAALSNAPFGQPLSRAPPFLG
jgi:hypothetical protein